MKLLSPAKVNLYLEIRGRRPDGYHEIQTLMHRVDLCDEVEIDRKESGIELLTEGGEEIPAGKENIAWRAAQTFLEDRGIREGVRIRLKKRIPVAAGLGGGSSNAATILLGMNELFQVGCSLERLMALGARLGADVPFFIFARPALAEGIGERLTPVELPHPLWFLLLLPPFRVSTAWVYGEYDRLPPKGEEGLPKADRYGVFRDLLAILKNDLERVTLAHYPQLGWMKEEISARGASGTLMSGSGPVLFGLFETKPGAERAGQSVSLPEGWRAVVARGI
jgi:4-diphosphocytidyl-2-C-methyl-D-erythritol kinase